MRKQKNPGKIIIGIALVCVLFFTLFLSCGELAGARTEKKDAQTPELTGDLPPANVSAVPGGQLSIDIEVAQPTDGGTLSFQWYKVPELYEFPEGGGTRSVNPVLGEPIPDADDSSLVLKDLVEGVFHVYLEITNTNPGASGARESVIYTPMITVTVCPADDDLQYPLIVQHPSDANGFAGEITLNVEANRPAKGGTLEYQWYSADKLTNMEGAPIGGATGPELKTNIDSAGEYFFYVVVSNRIQDDVKLMNEVWGKKKEKVMEPQVDEDGNPVLDDEGNQIEIEKEIEVDYLVSSSWSGNYSFVAPRKSITSHPAVITLIAEMEPNANIVLNPNRKYQYVYGFGGMDIPWSNFTAIKQDEYKKMYDRDKGLGFNIIRIMIMPGIIPPGASDVDPIDTSDDIEKTMEYYVKNPDSGNAYRPDYYWGAKFVNDNGGYVLASPWSPPPKWKTNNSKNAHGTLIKANYQDYADYLKRFAQHMAANGAPIYAISIQNEPNYSGDYDGCEWSGTEMRDFFKQVGHFTTGVKGWGGGKETPFVLTMNGESANDVKINDPAMDDPISRAAIDILGRHTYGNAQERYGRALDGTPKREVWMTEHNINSGNAQSYPNDYTWNYVWVFLNDVDLSIRLNDEGAFIWWALRRFYSFIGEGQYGTTEGAILPRGYAMSHYAKFAKEMYRCGVNISGTTANGTAITTTGGSANVNNGTLNRNGTDVKVTGFVSEDGDTLSLVMYTPTAVNGSGGYDMGTIKINLPSGFTPTKATAMRSTAAFKAKTEDVLLSNDKTYALVNLPRGNILSVRFTK